MSIVDIKNVPQLNTLTSAEPQKVSVIDFHAVWCGPCKVIAPTFSKLATLYSSTVNFLKVDVDAAKDVAAKFQISAMPTFVILKGSNKVAEMKGADPRGLEALVNKWAPQSVSSASGGASTSSAAPADKGLEGYVSINGAIERPQVTCLNEDDEHTIRDLLQGGGDKWLQSDSDAQLLLHLPLQKARIRAIRFTTLPSVFALAPKTVRLFVNKPTLGFDDAESLEAAQEIVLTEAQAKGEEAVQLRFVRFQSVNTISIFIADNQGGDDITRLDKIELIGSLVDSVDMTQLKKGEHDHDH